MDAFPLLLAIVFLLQACLPLISHLVAMPIQSDLFIKLDFAAQEQSPLLLQLLLF